MAHAPSHHKQMENLMGAEILMPGIEDWQLQRIDDAAHCVYNPAGQQPTEGLPGQRIDNLGKSQDAYPSHRYI